MIDLLIILLVPALKFLSSPRKYWYFFWAPIPAFLIDLIIAHTSFALVAGRIPQGSERTVSDMLENLSVDHTHPDHKLFWEISLKINSAAGMDHIKSVAK